MNKFTAKQVKRAIRDFESNVQDIMGSDIRTYEARIKSFVTIINTNPVINSIVSPLLEIDINIDQIHEGNGSGWITLNLPIDTNEQIAYILKVFIMVAQDKLSFQDLTLSIYASSHISSNIEKYLNNIARPALRELIYRLNDLIEDEVDGKDEVKVSSLQIINHGTISAPQGNIGLGQQIQQNLTNNSIAEDIMKQVREERTVNEADLPEVESLAQEVEAEIVLAEPSRTKLKDIAGKVFAIGQQGLLRTFTNVVNNPAWAQAVTDHLLGQ